MANLDDSLAARGLLNPVTVVDQAERRLQALPPEARAAFAVLARRAASRLIDSTDKQIQEARIGLAQNTLEEFAHPLSQREARGILGALAWLESQTWSPDSGVLLYSPRRSWTVGRRKKAPAPPIS